ncbi:transient receptor potential cation channel subfamily M member 2-like [Ostrea edulis]|uniref:transient receptor potential cation channel subfamily M member 2-like n=1 Tax=Ostrea edulis TaxID=37623 RepID=UPI0024AF1AD2|nr:transient receptor potential cation channel subfamily M member 2-like [Ostrea edulis]
MQQEHPSDMYPSTSRQDFDFDAVWKKMVDTLYEDENNKKTPTMVFSVIGDSNSFVPSPWPKAVFQTGLIEAAKDGGDTWIIYHGKENGLSKIIRDAYRIYENMEFSTKKKSMGIADKDRHVKLISITKTKRIKENAQSTLELTDVEKNIGFARFISKKEGIFSSQNEDLSKVPVPVAIVVCEGDIFTIAHVEKALEMKLPVIVVKGSGKVADLIVDYLENPESLKRKASLLIGIRFDDQKFKELEECLRKIKEKKELLSFFDVNNDDPLMFSNIVGEAIVSCWAMEKILGNKEENSGEGSVYATGWSQHNTDNKLSIAFKMLNPDLDTPPKEQLTQVLDHYKEPRMNVMKSTFSTPSSLPLYFFIGYQLLVECKLLQDCGHILLLEALRSNRCDYVRVLLDQDVKLNVNDLAELYGRTITCKGCEDEGCLHIYGILKLIDKKLTKKLFPKEEAKRKEDVSSNNKANQGSGVGKSARELCRKLLKYDGKKEDVKDTDISDILLWALFANRRDLAEICWLRSEDHLLTGLISSALLKKLSRKANNMKEERFSRDLENHSMLFQKRCFELMDRMYDEKMKDAMDLMGDKREVWEIESTPLMFAYENFMYDIVAHTCSQKNMSRIWYNGLPPDTWPFIRSIGEKPRKFFNAPLTKYVCNFAMFFSMLMMYSAFVLTSVSTEYYDRFLARFLEYYVYFWGAGDLIEEFYSCFGGSEFKSYRGLSSRIKRHFYNFWNIVDLISYVLLIVALGVRHLYPSTTFAIARRMFSLSLLAMYLRFLEVFLINRHMGPTLIMIKEMLKDLLRFLALTVFVVVGVGMYYHANLWPDHQTIWDGGWTEWRIWDIIYYPYWQLYGESYNEFLEGNDLSDCSNVTSVWQNDPSIDRCPQEDWTVSTISALYMLFSNLLLVNLVIAKFSYTFERVQENSEKLWRFQRFTVIIDYQWRIPSPINIICLPLRLYSYLKKKSKGAVCRGFQRRWSSIPMRCSMQLMSLCLSWDQHKLGETESDIISLESSLQLDTTLTEFQEVSRIKTTSNTALISNLEKVQQKKFECDGIHDRNNEARTYHTERSSTTINVTLSNSETSLLSKSLNLCPTPREVNDQHIREDTRAFFRRLRLKEHFSLKDSKDKSAYPSQDAIDILEKHPLYIPKSTREPPPGKCGSLESYIEAVEEEINNIFLKPDLTRDNLSKEERSVLQTLKTRDNIVIKKANKGSTVVVMDKD